MICLRQKVRIYVLDDIIVWGPYPFILCLYVMLKNIDRSKTI